MTCLYKASTWTSCYIHRKKNKMASYYNLKEYQKVLNLENIQQQVDQMKYLADRGNVQAAYWYGDGLMRGIWDLPRMELDFACGKLLPPTANPREDPYLFGQRDQMRALEYIKRVACFQEVRCVEAEIAGGLIAYIRLSRPEIGFTPKRFTDRHFVKLFEGQAKTIPPAEARVNPLIALIFVRPQVYHPVSKIFLGFSAEIFKHLLFEAILTCLFPSVYITVLLYNDELEKVDFVWMFLGLVIFFWPALTMNFLNFFYGIMQRLPLCSCPEIKAAYELRIKRLPQDCLPKQNPFESTSLILRHFNQFKQNYYIFFLIISIIMGVSRLAIKTEEYLNISWPLYLSIMIMGFIVPVSVLLFDKTLDFKDRPCLNQLNLEKEINEQKVGGV